MNYLALGDSYTIGERVAVEARWPVQLVAALRRRNLAMDDVRIIARTGWTVDELNAGIRATGVANNYNLVSLQIGVNDQYRSYPIDTYHRGFRILLEQTIGFAGGNPGRVMVISIPDWGVTPFANGRDRRQIAAEIDHFNHINLDESLGAGVQYIDVTPASRLADDDVSLLASDGLHPSRKMYEIWVQLILPVALKILTDHQSMEA